jgi:hypothetical protein
MTLPTLMFGLLDGSLGTGYFIYGRKQQRAVPMLAGAGLLIVPYLLDNVWLLAALSAVLCFLPFLIRSD